MKFKLGTYNKTKNNFYMFNNNNLFFQIHNIAIYATTEKMRIIFNKIIKKVNLINFLEKYIKTFDSNNQMLKYMNNTYYGIHKFIIYYITLHYDNLIKLLNNNNINQILYPRFYTEYLNKIKNNLLPLHSLQSLNSSHTYTTLESLESVNTPVSFKLLNFPKILDTLLNLFEIDTYKDLSMFLLNYYDDKPINDNGLFYLTWDHSLIIIKQLREQLPIYNITKKSYKGLYDTIEYINEMLMPLPRLTAPPHNTIDSDKLFKILNALFILKSITDYNITDYNLLDILIKIINKIINNKINNNFILKLLVPKYITILLSKLQYKLLNYNITKVSYPKLYTYIDYIALKFSVTDHSDDDYSVYELDELSIIVNNLDILTKINNNNLSIIILNYYIKPFYNLHKNSVLHLLVEDYKKQISKNITEFINKMDYSFKINNLVTDLQIDNVEHDLVNIEDETKINNTCILIKLDTIIKRYLILTDLNLPLWIKKKDKPDHVTSLLLNMSYSIDDILKIMTRQELVNISINTKINSNELLNNEYVISLTKKDYKIIKYLGLDKINETHHQGQ